MLPALPAEVLDHILSFLQSDPATLEACSRSHPIISQFVERHLYTNIKIQGPRHDFLNKLHDHPHIANYVQALEIIFERSTIAYLEDISSILPKLLVPRRIGLTCTDSRKFSWQKLPETFRLAFQDCLRLPSVKDISICSMAFPLSILSHGQHIRHLFLRYWQDDRGAGGAPMAGGENACLPTIDSLTLRDCWWHNSPSCVSTICSWIESRHLSSLEFSHRIFGLRVLRQILISCSHSLTTLDVNMQEMYGSYYKSNTVIHPNEAIPISLSELRNLQQLAFRARLLRVVSGSWTFSSPIFVIAEIVKSACPLKRLILEFEFMPQFNDYAEHQITGILCTPLHSLLVHSASTINSIHLNSTSYQVGYLPLTPSIDTISMFAGHSGLKQFVESGKLILTSEPIGVLSSSNALS